MHASSRPSSVPSSTGFTPPTARNRSEVSTLVGGFLGPDGAAHSVVTRELAPFEHVNLQTAVDAWSVRPGRTVEVRGLTLPPHHAIADAPAGGGGR